ncbi:NAD(P)/FAD-dependent oxidoreductase [Ectobacillus ponti]|uniref:NAD(P)/FAD-dependent oxidoreductase n=1 Tax=Ectobacillus ponti TaxID=2961894 RepID=A0AA41XD49_9BACI|nr:NAD(P)/FAD-dependent oxidoreductase [Ectobacillus ponti]MCP8969901.1 NAD(P)/FAD-dependent oxidoreductase [Ectobacillus ponti]
MNPYDCLIVGGGIAGLQAAIQLGRYQYRVLVIDSHAGRSVICKSYHNILGWPDGVSGETLRHLGIQHALKYHVSFVQDTVLSLTQDKDVQRATTATGTVYTAKAVLLATGLTDHIPEIAGIYPCLGISIYVCPDCDGYEVRGKQTAVLGSGDAGAGLALALRHWTDQIVYMNHGGQKVQQKLQQSMQEQNISYIEGSIHEIDTSAPGILCGIRLADGAYIGAERAFVAFGGNEVHSKLAEQAGIRLNEKKHIIVNPRTKETSVPNIWAAGDLADHSQQVTIAMGDGAQAAIWIHKRLAGLDA